jgi:hypothetical protein
MATYTGGVERTAAELERDGKLGTYLHWALRAELLLLQRAPAHQRVQGKVKVPTRGNPLGK